MRAQNLFGAIWDLQGKTKLVMKCDRNTSVEISTLLTAHGWKSTSNSGILHQQKFSAHLIIGSRDDDRRGDFCPICPSFVSIGEDSISSGKIRLRRVLSFCPIYKKYKKRIYLFSINSYIGFYVFAYKDKTDKRTKVRKALCFLMSVLSHRIPRARTKRTKLLFFTPAAHEASENEKCGYIG